MPKEISIVCFSVNNWESRKARKQQFMLYLSRRPDVSRVLYVEPPLNFWKLLVNAYADKKTAEYAARKTRALHLGIMPLAKKIDIFTPVFFLPFAFAFQPIYNMNLYIAFLFIKREMKKADFKHTVLWLYHPFDYPLLKWFKGRALSVFDWAEEWADYFIELKQRRKDQAKMLEGKIIRQADVVFTVSAVLLEEAKKNNPHAYHLLDGTVYEVFQGPRQGETPQDLKDVPRPILGYLGTVNDRVDNDILERLAQAYPRYSIVLIGNLDPSRTDISRLKAFRNIYLLGGKKYEETGNYTRYFDLCLLPYKPQLTLSFPTKILDYFATGKPVVSTNLIEIARFKDYLYVANSADEFVKLVDTALKENDTGLKEKRRQLAQDNTWEKRAAEICEIINREMQNG